MSAYFTTHHFSPRWSAGRGHHGASDEQAAHPPTAVTAPTMTPGVPHAAADARDEHGHRLGMEALARFLHAFTSHYGEGEGARGAHHRVVHPHFDLVESRDVFAVYGELPGLGRDDISVEVNDHLFTVSVAGLLRRPVPEGADSPPKAESAVGVVHKDSVYAAENEAEGAKTTEQAPEQAGEQKTGEQDKSGEHETPEENKEPGQELHWHVTERKVGDFRRVFQFPIEVVDMSAVRASMQNGLLTIVVPKRSPDELKKIGGGRKVEVAAAEAQGEAPATENA